MAVLVAVCGCASTRGKSVRNSGNRLVIFPLIVRAEYSCLGEATQQGTILWASTYKRKIECSRNNDRKNKVNTHEMRMRSAASVFIPITLESGEQIKRENSLGTDNNQDTEHPISTHLLQIGFQKVRVFFHTCMKGMSLESFFLTSSNHCSGSLIGEKSVTTAPKLWSDTKPGRTFSGAPCSKWNWTFNCSHSCYMGRRARVRLVH